MNKDKDSMTLYQFIISLSIIGLYMWTYFLSNDNELAHQLWLAGSVLIIDIALKYSTKKISWTSVILTFIIQICVLILVNNNWIHCLVFIEPLLYVIVRDKIEQYKKYKRGDKVE